MKVCTACGAEYGDEVLFCQRDGTPLRPAGASADLVGQVIAERYHVQKKLGEGGMGQVYLAEHVKMGRRCAIKIMTPGLVTDPDAISRFNREAANASRISHPNVCAIYDFGETPDGLIYLAMEFIEGRSLTGLLEEQGTLPLARAASILTQCADALQAAHDLGIVHRDLKPDNIMVVTARGRDTVKVVDFGIAKAVGPEGGQQKVTKTGFVVGTPEYMSPEQLAGDPVDGRSDLYSLALVFYRMLTGGSPFPADSQQETMIKRLTEDPLPLAAARPEGRFPPALQRVMDRALARSPADRYATAAELGREVKALAGSATGQVDVDAGTQVFEGDRSAGTVPATRVDPLAASRKPGAQPQATRAEPAPAPRRAFPLVPVAVAVALLVLGGGTYAFREALFGGARTDSLSTPGPGTKPPAGAEDTNQALAAGAAGVVRPPAGQAAGTPPPAPPADTAPQVKREKIPVAPDSAGPTGGGGGREAPPDLATLERELNVYWDDPEFVDDDAKRVAGKRLGERVFGVQSAPAILRARAAAVVASAYMKEQNRDQARTWIQQAHDLDPANPTYKNILDQF
jgi:serine/threonine-protein kinase